MGEVLARSGPVEFISVAIAGTATTSAAFECPGRMVALELPATHDGTLYTIHASSAIDGTFAAVKDSTGTNSLAFTAVDETAAYFNIEPAKAIGVRYFKVVAGTAQTGSVTLKVGFIR